MARPPVERLLDDAPWTPTHRRVWLLSSMGILLDGFDFFIMGVALPLIVREWSPSSWQTGLLSSAAVLGAMVGASTLGALTDRIGRSVAFKVDLGTFVVFALASAFAPSLGWLIAFRFLLGVGIGADYPISSAYVSEIAPGRVRSRLLVGTFSFQAIGQLVGVAVGLVILNVYPELDAWRWMLGFGVVPALVIVWLRRTVPESPRWLCAMGRHGEAADVLTVFCRRPVAPSELTGEVPVVSPGQLVGAAASLEAGGGTAVVVEPTADADLVRPSRRPGEPRWRDLFSPRLRRATALTAVPWFFMDIATYGIGVFTPTIIAAIVVPSASAGVSQFIADDITSTEGAAFVDVFLVVGFALAIWLIVKVGKVRLQAVGFVVMAAALLVLGAVSGPDGAGDANFAIVFVAFAAFNLFMNMGPNATTYVMPAEVYPTRFRAAGAGLAASAGKAGAAVGTFFFPIVQDDLGLDWTLALIAAGCVVAAVVTVALRSVAQHPPAAASI